MKVPPLTVYRLPRSHWHCTLDEFEWGAVRPPSLKDAVLRFMDEATGEQHDGPVPHMILTGKPGIGKSHIGVGMYRIAANILGTVRSTWLNVPDFCAREKSSYGQGDKQEELWRDVEEATGLVVLDDLFGRDLSMHEIGQILYRIIDTVYRNNAALVVTANPDVEEWTNRLDAHEISRLLAGATVYRVSAGKDWRLGG